MKSIAYQGITGSYSYIVAHNYFGSDKNYIGTKNFREIFELINNRRVDYGIIPVENSLAGAVYENYDLFTKFDIHISGEYILKIEHNLLANPYKNITGESRIKIIKKIYSHPKALEQCQNFFLSHPWIEEVQYFDTARAAKYVTDKKDITLAAIASTEGAKLYSLQIVKKHIEDNDENWTRFLIISLKENTPQNVNKCTVLITLSHVPGELWRTLKIFSNLDLNLTQIETRPIHGRPFEYMFFIDYEFSRNVVDEIKQTVSKFKRRKGNLKMLGFYKKSDIRVRKINSPP